MFCLWLSSFSVTRRLVLAWFLLTPIELAFRPKSCSCGRHSARRHSARSAFGPKRWSAFRLVGIQAASHRNAVVIIVSRWRDHEFVITALVISKTFWVRESMTLCSKLGLWNLMRVWRLEKVCYVCQNFADESQDKQTGIKKYILNCMWALNGG